MSEELGGRLMAYEAVLKMFLGKLECDNDPDGNNKLQEFKESIKADQNLLTQNHSFSTAYNSTLDRLFDKKDRH